MRLRRDLTVPLLFLCACSHATPSVAPAPAPAAPAASETGITARDLEQRLAIVAADSMQGRETGTIGNMKATDYIAAEFRRLGLEPAGDSGGYFQTLPLAKVGLDGSSTIRVGGSTLVAWKDFAAFAIDSTRSLDGVQAVYGGSLADSTTWISPSEAAGRIVILGVPAGQRTYLPFGILTQQPRFARAVAVAAGELNLFPPDALAAEKAGTLTIRGPTTQGPFQLVLSPEATTALLGAPIGGRSRGALSPSLQGSVVVRADPLPAPARNVVAVLRGSDPRVRGEFVALGAHNDHLGLAPSPADHDSIRVFNRIVRPRGADSPQRAPTAAEAAMIRAALDTVRKRRPPRPDSVYNGADDDGSGTVALLEIAQAAARAPLRPRRSLLFVSHTGEEEGVFGSSYFVDHPTVPRDSIVAQLNMDMIGRGDAVDLPGGGPSYLQVVGSRRLSTELGDLAERVNAEGGHGFQFNYSLDAPGDPEQVYCRSDHTEYARYGIPVIFVTTDLHEDYHQLTDEPQYIDYAKLARVAGLEYDLARTVANLDHWVLVDHPKPDPAAPCRQ
ncbi:MAG TPA: M28 family peptidase [Gemmatimonadales bacterium]|nr:M28 family peptidase [Gemmatimonadales bacterium]